MEEQRRHILRRYNSFNDHTITGDLIRLTPHRTIYLYRKNIAEIVEYSVTCTPIGKINLQGADWRRLPLRPRGSFPHLLTRCDSRQEMNPQILTGEYVAHSITCHSRLQVCGCAQRDHRSCAREFDNSMKVTCISVIRVPPATAYLSLHSIPSYPA